MSIYDEYPMLVPTWRYGSGAPGERPDIQHRWEDSAITREVHPAPPRLKTEAERVSWGKNGEGEVKLIQILRVACPKCHTSQALACEYHYAPAMLRNGIFSKEERELALAQAVNDLGRDNSALRRSLNQAEHELDQRRPIAHEGAYWAWTYELLDGADVY